MTNESDKADHTLNIAVALTPFLIMLFLEFRPQFIIRSSLQTTHLPVLNIPVLDVIIFGCASVIYIFPIFAFCAVAFLQSRRVTSAAKAYLAGWFAAWCWFLFGSRILLGR
jgi:hypothetical protein